MGFSRFTVLSANMGSARNFNKGTQGKAKFQLEKFNFKFVTRGWVDLAVYRRRRTFFQLEAWFYNFTAKNMGFILFFILKFKNVRIIFVLDFFP